ncbi:hypothetical protein PR048_015420 [Dryococelus australis]|uniref:DUF7869 domain-containing protein n=1 Tax=Dryococelus australis TaxID=614101 RepID=A0ABQ9HGW7_9NEOP|nr:hypothetical protein PR048_015420 [Dryococelus australis]
MSLPNDLQSRKRKAAEKKEDIILNAKVKGIEHTNHVGKLVRKLTTEDDCRCSRFHCFEKIPEAERRQIMKNFNDMTSKNKQDSHLSGLIALHIIACRHPQVSNHENSKEHSASYAYDVRLTGMDVPICHKDFISIHGIRKHRVNRLQQSLVTTGQSPKDQRGRHENRPTKIQNAVMHLIECHINSFQARKSHYSLHDNPHRRSLPEHLAVAKMHNCLFKNITSMFLRKSIDWFLRHLVSVLVTLADTQEESCILEKEKTLHLKRADAYRAAKKKYTLRVKQGSIHFLSFDYMQNLPLPHITINVVFCSRQLWYNIFGVHNLGDDSVTMYSYCEHEGKKGPNEVTSMLLDKINHNREDEIKELVLTRDRCPGQNNNSTTMHFIYCLAHVLKVYDKVTYIFPVRGHTYMPNDQDFSLIGHKKKSTASAELPVDWDSVIFNARKCPTSFSLDIMRYDDFKDIKAETGPFFLKTPKSPLQIKEARVVQVVKGESTLRIKITHSGPWATQIVHSRQPLVPYLDIPALYQCNAGIKSAKANDLAKLMAYLECPANRVFYDVICVGPLNGSSNNTVSDFEVDENDNSSGCDS